jgi:hypothetical protein
MRAQQLIKNGKTTELKNLIFKVKKEAQTIFQETRIMRRENQARRDEKLARRDEKFMTSEETKKLKNLIKLVNNQTKITENSSLSTQELKEQEKKFDKQFKNAWENFINTIKKSPAPKKLNQPSKPQSFSPKTNPDSPQPPPIPPLKPSPKRNFTNPINPKFAYAFVPNTKIGPINDQIEAPKTQNTFDIAKVAKVALSIITVLPALIWVINQTYNSLANYFANRKVKEFRF